MTDAATPLDAAPAEANPFDLVDWAEVVMTDATIPPLPDVPRLRHACEMLALPPAAPAVMALLFGLWAAPQPRPPVTMGMLAHLFGPDAAVARDRMAQWSLLREVALPAGAGLAIALDETFGDWMLGGTSIPPVFSARVADCPEQTAPDEWPVVATAAEIAQTHTATCVCLYGPKGVGARAFVGQVGAALGCAPLCVDAAGLDPTATEDFTRLVERAALLDLRPLFWITETPPDLALLSRFPLRFQRGTAGVGASRRCDVHLPVLGTASARKIWAAGCGLPVKALDAVAQVRGQTPALIARALATSPQTAAAARAALHAARRDDLPGFLSSDNAALTWDDIVLPERVRTPLKGFCNEVRLSQTLWDDAERARLFPRGRGVFALIAGVSGTGKTMAAQVIAHDLGMDLYRVDAGALTSKYVGETAQHLQQALDRASGDGALLFFDECDGLFGKRVETRDAQDRYQNADTNVLLAAVERYEGACIMATNRRDNIDAAFSRRLRYAVEIPRPDAAARLQIWQQLLAALVPCGGAECADLLRPMAIRLDLTGAQIKNAVLTAVVAMLSRDDDRLLPATILSAIDQELAKENRALSVAEREALMAYV